MPDDSARAASIIGAVNSTPSFAEVFGAKPEKGYLKNLDNQRVLEFLFNPVKLNESYEAVYARMESPGLSHERLQFTGNKNARIPLDLVFDEYFIQRGALSGASVGGRRRNIGQDTGPNGGSTTGVAAETGVEAIRRFFLEVIYPRRSQRLASASPPPVLFVWPGMIAMRVFVTKVQFKHSMFQSGRPLPRIMTVSVELEEDVQERIYSDQAATHGTQRPWATSDRSRRRG